MKTQANQLSSLLNRQSKKTRHRKVPIPNIHQWKINPWDPHKREEATPIPNQTDSPRSKSVLTSQKASTTMTMRTISKAMSRPKQKKKQVNSFCNMRINTKSYKRSWFLCRIFQSRQGFRFAREFWTSLWQNSHNHEEAITTCRCWRLSSRKGSFPCQASSTPTSWWSVQSSSTPMRNSEKMMHMSSSTDSSASSEIRSSLSQQQKTEQVEPSIKEQSKDSN